MASLDFWCWLPAGTPNHAAKPSPPPAPASRTEAGPPAVLTLAVVTPHAVSHWAVPVPAVPATLWAPKPPVQVFARLRRPRGGGSVLGYEVSPDGAWGLLTTASPPPPATPAEEPPAQAFGGGGGAVVVDLVHLASGRHILIGGLKKRIAETEQEKQAKKHSSPSPGS